MQSTKTRTERFRPDVTLGGTVEGLSLPQQEVRRDVSAEQKHQVRLVATQEKTVPFERYANQYCESVL
jgi:hypothetical protein